MKRRGMALGLAALMTCTALFTTTAKAENKGSDEKETIKFTYWGSGDEKKAIERAAPRKGQDKQRRAAVEELEILPYLVWQIRMLLV